MSFWRNYSDTVLIEILKTRKDVADGVIGGSSISIPQLKYLGWGRLIQ